MTTTTTAAPVTGGFLNKTIRIVREYPHSRQKVWRALTDPELMKLWMMRPEGFAPVVGTKFRLVAKPQPGWRGYVDCTVLEIVDGKVLRFSWDGDPKRKVMEVTYRLEDTANGTRLTFEHVGFEGIGGWILATLMMGPGWRGMMNQAIPAVLADLNDDGTLRAGSTLRSKF